MAYNRTVVKLNTKIKTFSYDKVDKICKMYFWFENENDKWRVIADARILIEAELSGWQTYNEIKPDLDLKKATDVVLDKYLDMPERTILMIFGEPNYTNICTADNFVKGLNNHVRQKYIPNRLGTTIKTFKYNNVDKIYEIFFWFEDKRGRWRVIADARYLNGTYFAYLENKYEFNPKPKAQKVTDVVLDKYLDMPESAILTIFGEPNHTNVFNAEQFVGGLNDRVKKMYSPNKLNTKIKTITYYNIDKLFTVFLWLENKKGVWRVIADAKSL